MKSALLVSLVCVLVPVATVAAQGSRGAEPVSWGFMAGGNGVTGGLRGTLAEGVVGGLLVQFPLEARHLSLRGDLMYHWISTGRSNAVDAVSTGGSGATRGGCASAIACVFESSWSRVVSASFSLVARLNDPAVRWSPYVLGGVAGYLTGVSDEPLAQINTNHVGFQGGIGFEVRARRSTLFAEMRYLGMPPGGIVPITIGMRF